jgi:hypothetical protein
MNHKLIKYYLLKVIIKSTGQIFRIGYYIHYDKFNKLFCTCGKENCEHISYAFQDIKEELNEYNPTWFASKY